MKKIICQTTKTLTVFGILFCGFFVAKSQVTVLTFTHTGAQQTFTIPSCVGTMTIEARAAQGGAGGTSGPAGALGGAVRGVITATPGQVMYFNVGGQGSVTAGGFNGGGAGGVSSTSSGAGGGGASDVRIGGNALSNRIIVAGAGGGGGGNTSYSPIAGAGGSGSAFTSSVGFGGAGAGGCASGASGGESGGAAASYGSGGGGGGLSSGGGGGGQPSATTGGYGCTGTLGAGGAGGGTSFICGGATGGYNGGGGGGGGYYGGGGGMTGTGGCNGGGGGGSSYINGSLFTSTSFTGGTQSGHGIITMTYALNGTGVSVNSNTTTICNGSSVTITGSGVISYTWLPVGSFVGSNASSIIHNPSSTTSYTVFGTNSIGCISNTVVTINVNGAVPSLTVVNTATVSSGLCPGKSATLTASGALNYNWTGGITNAVSFTPSATSGYTVTGSNACGTSTAATSISIHPLPIVGYAVSVPTLCSGLSTILTGTGNAVTYTWTGGVTNGVSFSPSASNNYTITGTSALTCTAAAVAGVTVVTTPSLTPTVNPVSICIGKSSTLTATGATNYTWLPGNASTSSIVVSPTAVVNTYTLIKSNANCVDTKTMNVFVNQLPTIFGIATPTLVCAGRPSTLSVGGAVTYTWTSPGPPTFTFTGPNPIVSPPASTTYTVLGTDANGCVNNATVFLAADPNPTVSIAISSSVICKGQTVNMTASGGINYTWTSTSGTVYTASYSDTPIVPTLYNVTADNSFSCTTTISQIVLVNPTPTINIAITKTLVCTGGPSTITASGANAYVWDVNANNATTPGTVVNPVATTIYTVQGTYTATGCQSTKTIQVNVFIPTITVTSPTNTCYGGNITLVASGANPNSYNWNTGSGFVNPFQTIAVTPTVFTIYTVSAVSGSNGVNCPSTQTTSIGIFYNPTITATPQRTFVCRFESVNLFGNGGVSYSWSNSQTGATITVNPLTNTNYTVTGTDANGCVNTGTIQVKISGCVGINELNTSVKNGISVYPNPTTGAFSILSDTDGKLNIVNELGQLIHIIKLTSANKYKVEINNLSPGVYFIVGTKDDIQVNQKIIVTK